MKKRVKNFCRCSKSRFDFLVFCQNTKISKIDKRDLEHRKKFLDVIFIRFARFFVFLSCIYVSGSSANNNWSPLALGGSPYTAFTICMIMELVSSLFCSATYACSRSGPRKLGALKKREG